MSCPSATTSLPIRRLSVFSHGVALVRRQGRFTGDELRIDLRDSDLDDVLRSLTVLDGSGRDLRSVEYRIAREQEEAASLDLAAGTVMLDLMERLVGWRIRVELAGRSGPIEGRVTGLQYAKTRRRLKGATLMLFDAVTGAMQAIAADQITQIVPLERRVGEDISHYLDNGQRTGGAAQLCLRLSAGEHQLDIGYLVSSPGWRPSYRVVLPSPADPAARGKIEDAPEQPAARTASSARTTETAAGEVVQLQAWAQLDNRFDEALTDVQLELVAGEPSLPRNAVWGGATHAAADDDRSPAATSADGRGASYEVSDPISVERGGSVLVPLVTAELPCRRELLFSAARHRRHPMETLRCSNDSGVTLEPGPATVFVDARYGGEAALARAESGGTLLLSYAVDQSVDVLRSLAQSETENGLRLEGTMLCKERATIHLLQYEIVNRSHSNKVVTIELAQDELPGELYETRQPDQRDDNKLYWRVHCGARSSAKFAVRCRVPFDECQEVASLDLDRLDTLLRSPGVQAATRRLLAGVREELSRIDQNDEQIRALQAQERRLVARQQHVRQNIAALASVGDEGDVRLKMVRELQAAEGALSGIEQLVGELQADSDTRRKAIPTRLPMAATPSRN